MATTRKTRTKQSRKSKTSAAATPEAVGPEVPAELIKTAKTTPLSEMPQAAAKGILVKFSNLGYRTLEEALGVLQVAGRELAQALDLSLADLQDFAEAAHAMAAPVTNKEREVIENAPTNLGLALDQIPALTTAPDLPPIAPVPPPAAGAAAPATVNHIAQMPPIRNQLDRGTCVAFASLAAYEHFLHINGTNVDLSEQFLYWNCKANDGYAGEGTWVRVAYERLHQDGCCLEDKWPYVPTPTPNNWGQGRPPAGAQIQALSYRPQKYLTLAPTSVADLKATLLSGRCISFSVPVYNTFMLNVQAKKTGDIPNPVPGEFPVGGHAMCFVGYVDDLTTPGLGGGRFLVRNSWGPAFGFASAYGPGYGTISYAYIARLCKEAFAIA